MRLPPGYPSALSVTAALALALLSQPVRASELAYEGFRPSFPLYANGGTGFAGPWTQGGLNVSASGYTPRERSLCHPKLQASEGGSVAGRAFPAINGALRDLAQPLGAAGTTVYVSFLLQPQGTLGDGVLDGFFGVTRPRLPA
jgi:hypothetical protein